MSKPVRAGPGAVYSIPIGEELFAFGVFAEGGDCAFFDLKAGLPFPSLDEVIASPIAFRVLVYADVIKKGKWTLLGKIPLGGVLAEKSSYWMQSVGSNAIYAVKGADRVLVSVDDVKNMEPLAFWDGQFIRQRLIDNLAGVENQAVKFFRKIKRYDPQTGQEIK